MTDKQESIKVCPDCGSTDIAVGVQVSKSAETGRIGLTHKKAGFLWVIEPLCANVCRKCGTIIRLYVKDTDHNWVLD
jgi:hypothetical protein